MMYLHIFSTNAADIIGLLGIGVMGVGVLRAIYEFFTSFINKIDRMTEIRISLVKHLSLGLEFLVARDIIGSMVEPTLDRLGTLAIIIILRTAVAFILHWEVKEAKINVHQEAEFEAALEEFEEVQAHHRHK